MTTLQDYKVKASLLLKAFKRSDADARRRFEVLPVHASMSEATVQRKHALWVIALENGFADWAQVKAALSPSLDTLLVPYWSDSYLKNWHADYEEARASLETFGGYLLPYKSQYFIVQRGYIEALGLDPDAKDWILIDFDAAKPKDEAAWARLKEKLEKRFL